MKARLIRAFFIGRNIGMSVRKLIKFFSTFSLLPVEIGVVVEQIVEEYKPADRIILTPVDVSPDALLGAHYRYIRRTGGEGSEIDRVVSISYSKNAPIEMQRLACCKELVHILDAVPFRTKTRAAVTNLVPRLLQPSNESSYGAADLGAFKDRLATYQALAILFPEEMREEFHSAYTAGRVSLERVAEVTCLPIHMVGVMLSDDWLPLANEFLDL